MSTFWLDMTGPEAGSSQREATNDGVANSCDAGNFRLNKHKLAVEVGDWIEVMRVVGAIGYPILGVDTRQFASGWRGFWNQFTFRRESEQI